MMLKLKGHLKGHMYKIYKSKTFKTLFKIIVSFHSNFPLFFLFHRDGIGMALYVGELAKRKLSWRYMQFVFSEMVLCGS